MINAKTVWFTRQQWLTMLLQNVKGTKQNSEKATEENILIVALSEGGKQNTAVRGR